MARFSKFSSISLLFLTVLIILSLPACTNISGAAKSSTSLSNFLGFSELPDWYIRNKYSYADSKWIKNDFGTAIHYRDVGKGPVVLLIHGEISSLQTWDKWIDNLSLSFRVIALDLPGSGLTTAPKCIEYPEDSCPENLTPEYLTHTLEYFIEDLHLDKFSLVGSSYGGYLAAQYASKIHPEKVENLILLSPMGYQQKLPWILNYVTTSGMDIFNRYIQPSSIITTIVDNFYGDKSKIQRVNLERYIHLAQSDGGHESTVRQLSFVRNLMEHGMLLDLSKITAPTLLMWGKKDTWGDYEHADLWKEAIPNVTRVDFILAGHALMEEMPDETSADAIAFIKHEPLPSVEGLGTGGTFTIDEAVGDLDKEALFGKDKSSDKKTDANSNSDTQPNK